MKKKGLVIIYDPHNLHQFLWYYSTHGEALEWDALCLPNGDKGEYMSAYCEDISLFKAIYKSSEAYFDMSMKKKAFEFIKMFFYCFGKRQATYAKKVLGKYVNIDDYDEIVVLTDVGFISGICLTLAKEKKVVILEDGLGDFANRQYRYLIKHLNNFTDWIGFILSFMGYANVGHYYPLRTTCNCVKFSSHPDYLLYKKYRKIEQLFDYEGTNMQLLTTYIEKLYPQIKEIDFSKIESILFTEAMNVFTSDATDINVNTVTYIERLHNNILLKKHPLDNSEYAFKYSMQEVPLTIPAEIIFPYIKNKKMYFMNLSSVLFYLQEPHSNLTIFYYDDLYNNSESQNGTFKYYSLKDLKVDLERFHMSDINIVKL